MDARRDEFWRALLAMGFAPQTAATGTYSGVELDARVFERGVYHTKAAELVLQFLLTLLDRDRFRREFFDCWPIGDPKQAREFRSRAFKWVEELRHASVERADGWWPVDVPVRRSFMDECRGARFEEVLWSLAQFVAQSLLRKGGDWSSHIKHPLMPRSKLDSATVDGARARYARRTRDRQAAQSVWRQTAERLKQQAGSAEEQKTQVHEAFRACRKRLAADVVGAQVPEVDCSAADVELILADAVREAKQLWAASAGWVESMAPAIDMVEMVADSRANSVRLDATRQLRLAPPPVLANQWTQWLASRSATPFRGPKVDLQVLARMASACVGALRGSIDAGSTDIVLDVAPGGVESSRNGPLADGSNGSDASLCRLDDVIAQQDARIARLKRVRAQLGDQRSAVAQLVRASGERECRLNTPVTSAMCRMTELLQNAATSSAAGSGSGSLENGQAGGGKHRQAAERAQELAGVWDELVVGEPYPLHLVDTAVHGNVPDTTPFSIGTASHGRSGLSFMTDGCFRTPTAMSQLAGGVAALSCARKRPLDTDTAEQSRVWKRPANHRLDGSDMLLDDEVPDFLVDSD